jgi:lipoprotein NlpI
MEQSYLNWGFGIVNLILGGLIKAMWDSYKDLKKDDVELAEKVNQIEILVAGQYVKRDDFDRVASAIFSKLDKISDKIDKKADR